MRLFTTSFAIAIAITAWNPLHAQMVDTTATKASLLAADAALAKQLDSDGPEALIRLLDPNAAVLMPEQPILRGADSRLALIALQQTDPVSLGSQACSGGNRRKVWVHRRHHPLH